MGDRRVRQYPAELRERAVRLVLESSDEYESQWKAIVSIAQKLGIGSGETLRKWVRDTQAQSDPRAVAVAEESAEVKRLRRENAELKRANDILKAAALDSGDQRNGAGGWGICGSDGSAGDVGSDEGRPVEALASR